MNIVDPILFRCRRQPPVAAICVPGFGPISYRRLENGVHNISRRIHALSLPKQSIVAVSIPDVIFHTAVLLALGKLGMITMSIGQDNVGIPINVDALITTDRYSFANVGQTFAADLSWMEGDGKPLDAGLVPKIYDDDLCRIIVTSRKDHAPNAVAVSHKLLANRTASLQSILGNQFSDCSRIYINEPLASSYGYMFLIYALSRGGMAFFPGTSFEQTLRAFEEFRVQCLIAPPANLEALTRWFDVAPNYQNGIDVLVCTDGMLSRSLSDRIRSRICPHLITVHGAAETGIFAAANAHEIAEFQDAVGFITPNVDIQIIDGSGKPLPPAQEGQLLIKSGVAVDGYVGNPEYSNQVFCDGWFHCGETGMLREFGSEALLAITGHI